jgi:hypothetical protein
MAYENKKNVNTVYMSPMTRFSYFIALPKAALSWISKVIQAKIKSKIITPKPTDSTQP